MSLKFELALLYLDNQNNCVSIDIAVTVIKNKRHYKNNLNQ